MDVPGTTSDGAPTGTTPRNTSHGRTRAEDSDDSMNAVYKAIIENPDFISRLADVLCSNPGGLHGPRGPSGPTGATGVALAGADHRHWRADEVGFFFPDLHYSYGTTDIVTIGKDSFYRNTTVFLDRLDDIVRLKGAEMVRSNLPTCLRGAALQWYTTELTDLEKSSLRSASVSSPHDPHRWRIALKRRWDPSVSMALQNFMNTWFTMAMVQSGTSVVQYFSTKI